MTSGPTSRRASCDPHAGLLTVLAVITTLGIAAKLLAPLAAETQVAAAPQTPEPARAEWFSLSFEAVGR